MLKFISGFIVGSVVTGLALSTYLAHLLSGL